ncbi:MAG: alpha-glucosidase [Candidatus Izimaplasma sp.]|nr:alpha-glucosidase [Candidatus Izimaplasma bacterium]
MIKTIDNGFEIILDGKVLIRHTTKTPAFFIGEKRLAIDMRKGEFFIKDTTPYNQANLITVKDTKIVFDTFQIELKQDTYTKLVFLNLNQPIQIHLLAEQDEKIYGLGEHFTSLNLRGHKVKNWVEEHITRKQIYNKIIRRLLHIRPKKWPFEDYKTYFITPSFMSSNNYFCHMETPGYGVFDFTHNDYHSFTCLGSLTEIVLHKEASILDLSGALCRFKGILPKLPDWIYDGMILGIQGGTQFVNTTTKKLVQQGAKINAIWAQDWCGEIYTYFGKQVLWNWQYDPLLYPDLKANIKKWYSEDIKFLGYINPYLNQQEAMFKKAKKNNYLVRNTDGSIFLTQATSFKFGIIDLTQVTAYDWFKDVIKTNMLGLGMMGWMADFGEYLPTDCVLSKGLAEDLHNQWPDLWIKLNREVLEETDMLSKAVFFNRAGYSNNLKYSTLIWNGDQHVDFTDDFGMKSALRAKLSLSLSGVGISHSDVGGYTTVPGIKRKKILFLRWLEMNTFTPVLRSHEGNRPKDNIQPYSTQETIDATVKFSTIHALLKPYLIAVEQDYHTNGYPMVRPVFFHYESTKEDAFLLGKDLYVCPILNNRQKKIKVTFSNHKWIHLLTGKIYQEGCYDIEAPVGQPAVFYRADSQYNSTFKHITTYVKKQLA